MSVVAIIAGVRCTVKNGRWGSPHPSFTRALNSQEAMFRFTQAPMGSVPDVDYARAQRMVEEFGGQVVTPEPTFSGSPGVVY